MDYDYDYDCNYTSDFEEQDINNAIDNFLNSKTDDVIDLYESIKQRFHMSSPFFLSYLYSYHLTEYIIDKYILKNKFTFTYKNKNTCNNFSEYYHKELQISYNDINKFIISTFKYSVSYNDWVNFCCLYTDLYELRN
jgi:hypothetical protein